MKVTKSAVFLFELMIIILVFTMAAAVCTRIFAGAYNMSTESRELTMSSINAQTVAERFKSGASDIEPLYFDSNWAPTDRAGASYSVELDERTAPNMREAYVNVHRVGSGDTIYTLQVKEFIG